MIRFITQPFAFASLAMFAAACSSSAPQSERQPTGKPTHEPPIGLQSTCRVDQLSSMGPIQGRDVAITASSVFLAKQRALFRFDKQGLVLEPLASFPEDRGPSSLVVRGNSIFASVETGCEETSLCSTSRVLRSDDDGDSWTQVGGDLPTELSSAVQLYASPERLIAADNGGNIASFDFDNESWTLVHADAPPDTPGDHLFLGVVGLDGANIVANDVYFGGMVELAPDAPAWQRIEGLGEWGYTGFSTRDSLKVTANGGGIFATVNGVWQKTLELQNGGLTFADLGDRFVASDSYGTLLESTDGVAWMVAFEQPAETWMQNPRLSRSGYDVVWLGPGLRLSSDGGKSWQELTAATEDVTRIVAPEGGVYAMESYSWRLASEGSWSSAPWDDYHKISFDPEGAYVCGYSEPACAYYRAGQSEPEISIPLTFDKTLRDIFSTSHGLFVSTLEVWDEACYTAVRDGLASLTPSGTLLPSAQGLPYTDMSAGCRRYWLVRNLVEVTGTLFVSMQDDWDTMQTESFRSTDGGASWTSIGTEVFQTVVQDERGLVALTATGELLRSTDDGASFSAIAKPTGDAAITDLVVMNDRLIISRSSKAAADIWTSSDDVSWTKLTTSASSHIGPVQDLDARDGKLWLATSTSGAWSIGAGCLTAE
jgi:hypothetical protein